MFDALFKHKIVIVCCAKAAWISVICFNFSKPADEIEMVNGLRELGDNQLKGNLFLRVRFCSAFCHHSLGDFLEASQFLCPKRHMRHVEFVNTQSTEWGDL